MQVQFAAPDYLGCRNLQSMFCISAKAIGTSDGPEANSDAPRHAIEMEAWASKEVLQHGLIHHGSQLRENLMTRV